MTHRLFQNTTCSRPVEDVVIIHEKDRAIRRQGLKRENGQE
jgi:hypothetical protein